MKIKIVSLLLLAGLAARLDAQQSGVVTTLTSAVFINQIVLVCITAALAFVATRYWHSRRVNDEKIADAEQEKKELQERVATLEKQLVAFSSEVQPISDAFRAILIKQLTHFHTPVLDGLMQKIGPPNTLTDSEMKLLCVELEKREKDMGPLIDDSERNAAKLLPLMVERMKMETEVQEEVLQVVAVPLAQAEEPLIGKEEPPGTVVHK